MQSRDFRRATREPRPAIPPRVVGVGAKHRGFRLLDLLVPERCAACGAGERIVCAPCLAALRLVRGPLCARCGAPTAWPVDRCAECAGRRLAFVSARAAVAYDGPARTLVAAWKERGRRRLAGVFARSRRRRRAACRRRTPSPSSRRDPDRGLWRGQNPAETLARDSSLSHGSCLWIRFWRRRRQVRPQRGLAREARRANVRGAFRATATPTVVALIDDVYTTGATVGSAATELRRAGARAVHVVTFARAVRR